MSRLDTRDLVDYPVAEGQHVLSVYLQTHSAESLTVFDNRIAAIQRRFEEQVEQSDFNECVDRVRRFLTSFEARAETLVLICNSTGPLWVRQLDVVLPNDVRWERDPYWKPLLEALDEFEPYAVVVVEKFNARLLSVSVSGTHEHPILKRTTEDLDSFLQKAISATRELVKTECPNRLIVAGDRDIRMEFLRLAPWELQQFVVGSMPLPDKATPSRILEATRDLEGFVERRHETKQVQELLRLAAKHKKVAVGLAPTLQAVSAGQVWTLLYSERLAVEGAECELCKRLYVNDAVICPRCNVATRPVPDVVALAITRALRSDASIEQLRGQAAAVLNRAGGIGAFLRY